MDSTAESPSLQVSTNDVLLIIATLISLTFRSCRQGIDPSASAEETTGYEGDAEAATGTQSAELRWANEHIREWAPAAHDSGFFSLKMTGADDTAPTTDTRASSDSDEVTTTSEPILPVNVAADPLLILAERLTLEEKLSTAVNWLSLVSNCLTYFLRPSQVLYTFLLTNGDFIIFVTTYSNRYQRRHPSARLQRSPVPDATSAPTLLRPQRQHAPLLREASTSALVALPGSPSHSLGSEVENTVHCVDEERRTLGHLRGDTMKVSVPPPSRSPFPVSAQSGPRHREGVPQHSPPRRGIAAAAATDSTVDARSPLYFKNLAFPLGRPLPRLRHYASRCVAFAQTQLSWLLVLNALLTFTLFVFHLHHLFFGLGTLFGYLAAVASVYLCGMEVGCIAVRLRRRKTLGGVVNDSGSDTEDNDGAGAPATTATLGSRYSSLLKGVTNEADTVEWDPCSGIHGPRWAFVGEHLSAAMCSLLYVQMLLDEGDVLWSSHVDLMRWYVCSCALMTLSLLKCLRVVF
jgi:hypothetical protein